METVKDLDEMIASWDASENKLMEEYKRIRQGTREKKLPRWRTAMPRSTCPLWSSGAAAIRTRR